MAAIDAGGDVAADGVDAGVGVEAANRDPRPRALLILLAVVVIIAAIGVIIVAVEGRGSNPKDSIEGAVRHSVQGRTADVALSLDVGFAGVTETIAGNGTSNLQTNATNMTMTFNAGGRHLVERAIIDGDTSYVNVGAVVGQVAPGKSWVSSNVNSGQAGPNGVAGGSIFSDPNVMVSVLSTPGTTVTPLGSSVVDGVTVQGYTIHLSPAGIVRSTSSGPAPLRAALRQVHYTRLDYSVFIDDNNYLREIRAVGGFGTSGIRAHVTSTVHFSNYGVPVTVQPPPADQVITDKQFERLAAQSQGLANT